MVAVGIAATALTVLALLLMLRTWRRETRVRVWLDGTRVVIAAGSIIGMMLVLGIVTPIWLGLAAGAVGLLLGAGQGRGLKVRWTERGAVARRTLLGLLAAGLGIIVIQAAATLNRAGIVRMGLAVSFISIGITVGLIWGRRRPMRAARSAPGRVAAAAGVVVVLATVLLSVGVPQASSQSISCPASVGELELRPPQTDELRALHEAGRNDPLTPGLVCNYWPPSDLLGVVSTVTIAVRWNTQRISGTSATDACGREDVRSQPGEALWLYQYSPVATVLTSVTISSPSLRYDETALDIAADALMERAEFLAASCEPEPPGGRFANRGPLPIPGFATAVRRVWPNSAAASSTLSDI